MTDRRTAPLIPAPIPSRPPHSRLSKAIAHPRTTLVLATLIVTAILLVMIPRPLSSDISGQLWIADRLRHGARLYIDISEINPPLWFWLAIPVDALSDMLAISAETVLITVVGAMTVASLLATDRLLSRYPPAARIALLLYAAALLLIMPLRDIGQREQMTLIAALPYVALITARRDGMRVPIWLAMLVAIGAAIGFAFKHYFIGVPLLLELWLLLCLRRSWRPVRPETLILLAGAAGYVVAILVVTPGYLQVSIPELMLAYGATGGPSLRYMIRPAQPVWVLILCGVIAPRSIARRPLPSITIALLIAAAGFALAWAIQHKGWPYQSIATTGMLAMALATLIADQARHATARPRLIAVAGLILPVLLCVIPTQWVPTPDTDIAPALADLRPGDTVAIIAKEGRTVWPSTVDRGLRFSGRRTSFWILAAVDANAAGANDPRIAELGREMIRETVIDYRCLPPRRLVFTPRATSSLTTSSDNPLAYFRRDPAFVQLFSHYRRLDRRGNFDTFELVRPIDPLPAAACPKTA